MDDTLQLDVYAECSDADVYVTHETVGESLVMVEIKSVRSSGSVLNMLHLWMSHPAMVIDLGKRLIHSGIELDLLQVSETMTLEDKNAMRARSLEAVRVDIGTSVAALKES